MNDLSDVSSTVPQPTSYHRGERYQKQKRIHATRLLLLYVVPLIVLMLYFLFQYQAIVVEGELVHLQAKAEEHASVLDLFLSERLVNLSQLMTDPAFRLPPTNAVLEEGLRRLKTDSDAFVDLSFIDIQGVQTAYVGPYDELVGRDYSGQPWYSSFKNQDVDYLVTDIYLGFRGRLHVTIAMRRVIDDGAVVLKRRWSQARYARESVFGRREGASICRL